MVVRDDLRDDHSGWSLVIGQGRRMALPGAGPYTQEECPLLVALLFLSPMRPSGYAGL